MSDEASLIRKSLAGLAALVVAAASLAVLPQPAQSIGDWEHDEGKYCYDGCDKDEQVCCAGDIQP